MSEEKKQELKFQELVSQREQAATVMDYSIKRIDLLIIALCTSGIFLATSTLSDKGGAIEMKWAILFFVIAIVINLISQFVSYYASRSMYKVYDQMVTDYQDDSTSFDEGKYEAETNAILIHSMNIISLVFLVAGMISCLLYYYCHF